MRAVSLSSCRSLVNISWGGASHVRTEVPVMWLMDQCRCPECYNAGTHQRTSHIRELKGVEPSNVFVGEGSLRVDYSSEHHATMIPEDTLSTLLRVSPQPSSHATLWDPNFDLKRDSAVHVDEPPSRMFSALQRNGVVLVEGVRADEQATAQVLQRLGFPKASIFGDIWSFSANQQFADSAYSTSELSLHTDGSYHVEPPGLESFHCVEFEGTGGESLIGDGWAAAAQLKRDNPDAYELLATQCVEWRYEDPGVALYTASAPVLRTGDDGELLQIRYNDGDRGYLLELLDRGGPELYARYIAALQSLYEIIERPEITREHALRPGTLMVLNNWRVLHAR